MAKFRFSAVIDDQESSDDFAEHLHPADAVVHALCVLRSLIPPANPAAAKMLVYSLQSDSDVLIGTWLWTKETSNAAWRAEACKDI